jgi:hypothetical protein
VQRVCLHSSVTTCGGAGKPVHWYNNGARPFVWTATAESILTKVRRGRVALNQAISQ